MTYPRTRRAHCDSCRHRHAGWGRVVRFLERPLDLRKSEQEQQRLMWAARVEDVAL